VFTDAFLDERWQAVRDYFLTATGARELRRSAPLSQEFA
jgi:hypothetical protein